MGDNEHFEDDYYGGGSGGGLEDDISGNAANVEEVDPFAALDDFASEGNAHEPLIDDKEPVIEDDLSTLTDEEAPTSLNDIEEAVDAESEAKKKALVSAIAKVKKKAAPVKKGKKVPAKKNIKKKTAPKKSGKKKRK